MNHVKTVEKWTAGPEVEAANAFQGDKSGVKWRLPVCLNHRSLRYLTGKQSKGNLFVYSVNDSRRQHTSIHLWGGRCCQDITADRTVQYWLPHRRYILLLRCNLFGTVGPNGIVFHSEKAEMRQLIKRISVSRSDL